MSITTKVGDRGTTRLLSGERVPKDSPRPMACGDVDELVSALGLARFHARKSKAKIVALQRALFLAGAELAVSSDAAKRLPQRITAAELAKFEVEREALERRIKMPKGFILPGGTLAAAHLDHARAVARRLERRVVGLARRRMISNPSLLIWLNRLSDYLWLLARWEEGRAVLPK